MNPAEKRRVAEGLCRNCGNPRAPNGSPTRCQPCAQKAALQSRQRKARARAGIHKPPGRPKKTKTPKPASQRATRSKQRRKLGLYLVTSILTEEHLDSLVKLEFLPSGLRTSRAEIQNALTQYLHTKLVRDFEHTAWAKAAKAERLASRTKLPSKPITQPQQPLPSPNQNLPQASPQAQNQPSSPRG
jgi:hypothetical protein